MKEVPIKFSCGHEAFATASLFKKGEEVPILCRDCKPSRIVGLLYVGTIAAIGSMIYGAVANLAFVLGGAVGVVAVGFLLFLFRK